MSNSIYDLGNDNDATQIVPEGAIAIIGLSSRLPKANSISEFWQNVVVGKNCLSKFELAELEDTFSAAVRSEPGFVAARGIVEGADKFDAEFFGIYAREAALMDPQHRVFLECSWEVLEDAGYDPARFDGAIGVFAGCSVSTYLIKHLCHDRENLDELTNEFQLGNFPTLLGNLQDSLAVRVAYKLNLTGPAITVGTYCSTSAVAVVQACQSLLLYQSDMAIAGGVSISFPQKRGYLYSEGGMAAREGVCRPYDADAQGTVFSNGSSAVLLKRAEDAVNDGDHIYALIRGFGINNDGANKVGFTAPSIDGQATCIASALAMADVDAATIGYVEGHGTATPLGDPIEFAALKMAYEQASSSKGDCAIGSGKANVGHLDAAAGVTGLIKAALTLDNELIPPLANYSTPNPRFDIENSGFHINAEAQDWKRGETVRRAGVSSFGVGGTNVHFVLEEAPATDTETAKSGEVRAVVLPLSARSEQALTHARQRLADHLEQNGSQDLADVAFTLQMGRAAFACRTAVVATSRQGAIDELRKPLRAPALMRTPPSGLAFLLPGQGAQYPGMGRSLYRSEPVFRELIDTGAEVLAPLVGTNIADLLYRDERADDEDAPHPIRSTILAQPALFLVEYALSRYLISCGLQPAALIGHSVGEFAAACLANVFSFEDGLKIIAARGRLMQDLPGGAMVAVRMAEVDLQRWLTPGVEIAALNAPNLSVVAGPFDAIEAFEARLAAEDLITRRLHTSHAFHSAMMDPVVDELANFVAGVRLNEPQLPYISCVTGDWITAQQAIDPTYWAQHCRATVRFADGLKTLRADQDFQLLEVGPGRTLSTFASQANSHEPTTRPPITVLPEARDASRDDEHFAEAIGQLWSAHVSIDFSKFGDAQRRRVSLPTYPFERKRHWVDAPQSTDVRIGGQDAPMAERLTTQPNLAATPDETAMPQPVQVQKIHSAPEETRMSARLGIIQSDIFAILETLSGMRPDDGQAEASFVEMGFDSLFLGQLASEVKKKWKVNIAFRKLMRDFPSPAALARHLDEVLPADVVQIKKQDEAPVRNEPISAPVPTEVATGTAPQPSLPVVAVAPLPPQSFATVSSNMAGNMAGGVDSLMRDQLATLQNVIGQQLAILQGQPFRGSTDHAVAAPMAADITADVATVRAASVAVEPEGQVQSASAVTETKPVTAKTSAKEVGSEPSSRFDAYKGVKAGAAPNEITSAQKEFIRELVARYRALTPGSQKFTQDNRRILADPRTANGFRAEWKDMVYPLVCPRSKGSKIWDVDGNEYIDLVNGYGPIAFGHSPQFVTDALAAQLELGFSTGPQSPLAGDVAKLFTELTGNERVTFCNTGSEAVMAAMRLARAVTGRNRIVSFAGSYHGQFDEVIVKGRMLGVEPGGQPAAAGIPAESTTNMVVLQYGAPESLEYIRQHADELAAVLVEVVQSRHPDYLPVEFIRELREITAKSSTALVFDEVVTGFRVHAGGVQHVLGIQADLVTYGKVLGGGMPIGALAGKAEFMDALDGGYWEFDDESVPEVAPTFFAGTFVRHPLVLAAVKSVLEHLRDEGPQLLERLSGQAKMLRDGMADAFRVRGLQPKLEGYSSYFYLDMSPLGPMAALFYPLMRLKGIHIQEGFPGFLTTAHSDADCQRILDAVSSSLDELQSVGIMVGREAVSRGVKQTSVGKMALVGDAPEPVPLEHVVPLTEVQREVWMAAQLSDAASCAFNESASLRLEGKLDTTALAAAFNDIINRHDALRASFGETGQRMRIAPRLDIDMPVIDVSDSRDPEASLRELLLEDACTPFDLASGPAVRTYCVRLADTRWVFVMTAHHIVCDGWSTTVILDDLSKFYAARCSGTNAVLPKAMSYIEYSRLEASERSGAAETEAFWLKQFEDVPSLPELPADRPRPSRKSFNGATFTGHVEKELYSQVKAMGAKQGCTLFATLFATFQVLAGRLAKHNDVVVAVPTAGQSLVDRGETLVGHCVNFLPLRVPFDFEARFQQHLANVQQHVLDAFDHQEYTFGTLVRKLALKRDMNRLPLTELQFNLEKIGTAINFGDLSGSISPNAKAFSNFDIFFNVSESEDGLRIDIDYSTDLFDEATIARFLKQYRTVLAAVAGKPEQQISRIPLIDGEEKEWLVQALNQTKVDFRSTEHVSDLFMEQAAMAPTRVAVEFADEALTYGQLDARSNQLARLIRAQIPGEGARIAVAMERSTEMLAVLLGVMKAGHTYVPLDPKHPPSRLELIIESADLSGLIVDTDELVGIAGSSNIKTINVTSKRDEIADQSSAKLEKVSRGSDLPAYVIFTSGSTGKPKGVEVPHRAVVNFLQSMAKRPGFTADDTIVAVTTVSFDIAVLELFLPLITGGRVVIASHEDVVGGFGLAEIVRSKKATMLQATPSLWRMMIEARLQPPSGMKMLCGGEPLPRDLADQLLEWGPDLWNMYGPTETTVWSSIAKIEATDEPILIGEPIDNTQLYVLDEQDQLCPVGMLGELYIGGDGLANGYFGRPDLTEAAYRMIAVDGENKERLYRTGDMAMRRADGGIQLAGRADQQIKLRGFRIELGDIESVLRKAPNVAGAAVALRSTAAGEPCLVGYVVDQPGTHPTPQELKEHCALLLPDYMVPAAWQTLESLPLTPNGKLDRKALPELAEIAGLDQADRAISHPPEGALEKSIAATWCDVLRLKSVGRDESIFALGADSLQIFRIAARLADKGIAVQAKHIMEYPEIRELSKFAEQRDNSGQAETKVTSSLRDFRNGARRERRVSPAE